MRGDLTYELFVLGALARNGDSKATLTLRLSCRHTSIPRLFLQKRTCKKRSTTRQQIPALRLLLNAYSHTRLLPSRNTFFLTHQMTTSPRMRMTVPHPQDPESLADARPLHSTRTMTGNHYLMLQLVRTEMPRTGWCLVHPDPNTFGTKTTQRTMILACCVGTIRYGWAISTSCRIPSSWLSSKLRSLSSSWAAPRSD
ncbi:uncharacterized protein LY79DRAFT_82213 [Colletotrichum navitas]|uniref:Uncharacterized protein n=1 Tax=Colletotrichum navitas TaxID=681940 RepID=A0AAD8Q5B7_9PEZI|nr:uncharacterized protein LY79DRAFT_82213 [Colletotrichum navitas]KAK1596160.1 hypothetical protein LY79DRAFT_82213 [Colletotrichum navitas]